MDGNTHLLKLIQLDTYNRHVLLYINFISTMDVNGKKKNK